MQTQYSRQCVHCGGMFNPPKPSSKQRYCSQSCFHAAKTGPNHPLYKPKAKTACPTCGTVFMAYPYKTRQSRGVYCSHACYAASLKTGRVGPSVQAICAGCGTSFQTWPYRIRDGAIYCSAQCRFAIAREQSRNDYGGWRYVQWRHAVVERDQYTCQQCGAQKKRMHAHHVRPWNDAPALRFEVSNGMTLCPKCHVATHR